MGQPPRDKTQEALYRAADFLLVRAPLLSLASYSDLFDSADGAHIALGSGKKTTMLIGHLRHHPWVRHALIAGSPSLLKTLERCADGVTLPKRAELSLLRYLVRMSTRPTPYGLFAGVALARWGDRTDLRLSEESHSIRARPDMAWLFGLVFALEARLEIRRRLRFTTNPMVLIRGGRAWLTERAPTGDARRGGVSVRCTRTVRRLLELARTPTLWTDLVADVRTPAAAVTIVEAEKFIEALWAETILLTDLRPPLTVDRPAEYIVERLQTIPEAQEITEQLSRLIKECDALQLLSRSSEGRGYEAVARQALAIIDSGGPAIQLDMALPLSGGKVSSRVGYEVARAAEILLRVSPPSDRSLNLDAYYEAFVEHYGEHRQVPLLELIDANFGLLYREYHRQSDEERKRHIQRAKILLRLAGEAIRTRQPVVELDDKMLSNLECWSPSTGRAPESLDVPVMVAASSRDALDLGEFQVIVSPDVGHYAAGRYTGRFASLIGPEALDALRSIVSYEEATDTSAIWAELVYLPRSLHRANLAVRPNVRRYEIVLGTTSSKAVEWTIPPAELHVGVDGGRFRIYWGRRGAEVRISSTYMLSGVQAPRLAQFLLYATNHREPELGPFNWGYAEDLPFLPRLQAGRVVLRAAQWRLASGILGLSDGWTLDRLVDSLSLWRAEWRVPRRVYLRSWDSRLLFDLEDGRQVEDLAHEVRRAGKNGVVLEEMLPSLEEVWVEGHSGRFMTEFVVPLVRRELVRQHMGPNVSRRTQEKNLPACGSLSDVPERVKPPGSEWLFVKLYAGAALHEELIAGPIRDFVTTAPLSSNVASWFFVRYADPEPHVRFRLRSTGALPMKDLLEATCLWASDLMKSELCSKFAFDSYDREFERYGGPGGMALAEEVFCADSRTVAELLLLIRSTAFPLARTVLATMSVDGLLKGLGLSREARLAWCKRVVTREERHTASDEFRAAKEQLRHLLSESDLCNDPEEVRPPSETIHAGYGVLASTGRQLQILDQNGELSRSLPLLLRSVVHMHCNRLLGRDRETERLVLGLLSRTRESLAIAPAVQGANISPSP